MLLSTCTCCPPPAYVSHFISSSLKHKTFGCFPISSSHLAYDAVLHVCLLVAALFAHQCDLQLTEGFGQDVALREELPPLHNVGLQQRCVVLVAQHPLQAKDRRGAGQQRNTGQTLCLQPDSVFIHYRF